MIESSICVPTDLGSKATLTPVPKKPFEPTPAQLVNIIKKIDNENYELIISIKEGAKG